jgi:hypothetical protein
MSENEITRGGAALVVEARAEEVHEEDPHAPKVGRWYWLDSKPEHLFNVTAYTPGDFAVLCRSTYARRVPAVGAAAARGRRLLRRQARGAGADGSPDADAAWA